MFGSFSKVAGGNIAPSRIVKLQTDGTVIQAAAATDQLFGISQPSTRRLALSGWDDGFAAIANEHVNIYGPGDDEAQLELGGTVSIGDKITSDGSGKGVASTTDKDRVIAIADRQAGVSGDVIRVKPIRFDAAV